MCTGSRTLVGGIPLTRVVLGDEYLEMVLKPKHGRGTGMNPCIDCRIMKIRMAGQHMREIGASFIFTGEVLGQRPMSQHIDALKTIDRETGLEGFVLRPLSAAHLEVTVPEKTGLVDRAKLLGIRGRSRRTQIRLAAEKGVRNFHCAAGGCLLTDAHFSEKLRDCFDHAARPSMKDIPLLRIGRHIRVDGQSKLVVARDERECEMMLQGNFFDPAFEWMFRYTKLTDEGPKRIRHLHGGECATILVDSARHGKSRRS